MSKLVVTLPVVFGAEAVLQWFFYRSRAVSHAAWTNSDFVVFVVPLVVGFTVAACVLFLSLHRVSPLKRVVVTLGASAGVAAVSSIAGMVVAFNLYGT